ncbi:glucose 1-dehydrogenase [Noviherbaspirillum sedimenti]|uniref:Glucose 1-dehydrogenase n=1 Tax=Noviherbaspirillum sedimenti TaxID=2320865 RepID=A0A3A3G9U8_9BURK|nr:glucose 1-dehydrogenase [Noviherbaspirillum sedimenti]
MIGKLLQDKVAIVTGAAQGMGAATARLFAEQGAHVVVADMNEQEGCAVVAEIQSAGGTAFFHKVNVSISSEVARMVEVTVGRFGRLDVAVNNAAVSPDTKPLAEMDEAEFDKVIAVDLKGVALCLKYELAQLIRQGQGGSIINIGSVSSFRPQPNTPVYVAAKHGVIGLTKVAALENGIHNIRVNAVAPGGIDTPMLRNFFASAGATQSDEAAYASALSLLGRFGEATEVAQASLWLASDLASYVTATTINVDAGYINR